MRAIVSVVTMLIVVVLSGCAMQPTVPGTTVGWDERRTTLLALEDWQARGRIAVKSAGRGGQGSLSWAQAGAESNIRLSGPFGAGAYEISWTPEQLVITGKDGSVQTAYRGADAARRFVDEQLGWPFPAQSTRYWLLGVPDPAAESREQFDADGWLVGIDQNGWSVGYDGFARNNDAWLPRKIVIESERARIRLVIDRWTL